MANSHNIHDETADAYSKSHARWLRFAGGEAQCAFEGAVTALLRPGMRMLDVACGTGTVARRLLDGSNGDFDLVLLDASQRMLNKCRDIPANRVTGCMKNLPFETDNFDLLTCAWGIETLDDPGLALA
jgi:ubiquinone/menaquinone biosynthesis C-methylase UbiE